MRSDNLEPLTKALEKYKDGTVWRMSGTRLKSNVQQEYMHSSLKLVVDMNNTKFASLTSLALTDVKHRTAQPSMSVAHCKALRNTQRFDITALVLEWSDPRLIYLGSVPGGPDREVRDVTLIDGSKAKDTDKLVEMKISIFSDASTSPEKERLLQLLTDVKGTNRAVSFFEIQCKFASGSSNGPDFGSSREFFALESTGPKAELLKKEQPKLLQIHNWHVTNPRSIRKRKDLSSSCDSRTWDFVGATVTTSGTAVVTPSCTAFVWATVTTSGTPVVTLHVQPLQEIVFSCVQTRCGHTHL